ncbi:MAG TPA: prefoldin subunit alpha [Candidatus Nanoarchaeia archaeon]|nr:prefoldin subunit alpha [Candidatus Nanoarchaeia archaeon]
MSDKQKVFDLQFTDKQLGQLKEHLERLDQQLSEVVSMRKALEDFKELDGNEELKVPITNGIFASAKLTNSKKVEVNVGSGIVVNKTIDEAIELIGSQLSQMAQYREQVLEQFNQLIQKAEQLAKDLQEEDHV